MASASEMVVDTGDDQVLESFIAVLSSDSPNTIPAETLYGAITHFLSTLTKARSSSFVGVLLESPLLWSRNGSNAEETSQCVRLSVSAMISRLDAQMKDAYFSDYRKNKLARQWLDTVSDPILNAETTVAKAEMLKGLVEGLAENQVIDWGSRRTAIEEELIVAVDSRINDPDNLALISSTALHVDPKRLMALNLKEVFCLLRFSLDDSLWHQNEDNEELWRQTVSALGRTLAVLDIGRSSDRIFSWERMLEFCVDSHVEVRPPQAALQSLSAFLLAASSIIDVISTSVPPSLPSSSSDTLHPAAKIAIEILVTLASFSELGQDRAASLEGYHKVLYGALDVLENVGGTEGATVLFDRLKRAGVDRLTAEHAAIVLTYGEQVVHMVPAALLRDTLLPIAQRYIRESFHPSAFEASHAFMVATIQATTKDSSALHDQALFAEELTSAYARLILRLHRYGDIKHDQIVAAFPLIVEAASHISDNCLSACLKALDQAFYRTSEAATLQTLRLLRIMAAANVPRDGLVAYLDSITTTILETDASTPERQALAKAAFKMVVDGLPDESKHLSMEWWMEWRTRILGISNGLVDSGVRAKL